MIYIKKQATYFSLICCFTFLSSGWAHGSNGWDYIAKNDNVSARKEFEKTLLVDSTDFEALQGMIYLSEIEDDDLGYKKSIASLINNHFEEYTYRLFENIIIEDDEQVAQATTLSIAAKIKAQIGIASDLASDHRDFKGELEGYRNLIGSYEWYLTGPFKNVAGSGHDIKYPPEKEEFGTDKIFLDETGLELSWIKPKYMANSGRVFFNHHLPSHTEGSTYYATTFIENPNEQTIQLRLGRSAPVKIWIDDQEVYNNNDKINFEYDNEIVELKLSKGVHRILVKNSVQYSAFDSYYSKSSYSLLKHFDESDFSQKLFSLRITDTAGNLIKNIIQGPAGKYEAGNTYKVKVQKEPVITYYHDQIKLNPDNLFNYYALCKAYLKAGQPKKAEEFYASVYKERPDNVLIKYVTAKIYAANGKIENVYEVLNGVDHELTPIFPILFQRFKEIDKYNEEAYLEALSQLNDITPGNYSVISAYIKYYDRKGMDDEKQEFVKEKIKSFPGYASRLERHLDEDDEDKKNKKSKEKTTYGKSLKEAKKDLKSEFHISDYLDVIRSYKAKDKPEKVIALYDELIAGMPHVKRYRVRKSDFLVEEKRYDEAASTIQEALQLAPFDADLFEDLADIYKEKELDDSALVYYKKALSYEKSFYASRKLKENIENIEGFKYLKNMFDTPDFDSILSSKYLTNKYKDEESMVLMHTKDLVFKKDDQVEVFEKLMIKILTVSGADLWTEYDFSRIGKIHYIKVIKRNGAEVVPDKSGGQVVFKNLEPGDVIKIESRSSQSLSSQFDRELILKHYLSFEAPVYYSKFEVAVPEGKYLGHLHHKVKNNLKRSHKDGYDFYRWEYDWLPRLEREEAILDRTDIYANIMISTMKDWSKVVTWYNRMTYGKLDATYDIQLILDTLITENMNEEEKVEAIYNYITREITYSYVPFLNSRFTPKNASNTCSAKIGDCKDVATLMITMLRAVGIESHYVLVKTNQFNHLNLLPSLNFDHAIVGYYSDQKLRFLDLTTNFYPHYVLTENDVDAWALLIKDGEKDIFRLPNDYLSEEKNLVELNIEAVLKTDRSMDLSVDAKHKGMSGGKIREVFARISEEKQKNYILKQMGKGVFENLELVEYKLDNQHEISAPLTSHYRFLAKDFTDKVSSLHILRMPFLTAIQPNPVISSKFRENRLDIGELCQIEPTLQKIHLTLPKDYMLLELPENINLSSKFGEYKVSFSKTKNGVYIEKYQRFYTKIVEVDDFTEFKNYYLSLLDADKVRVAIHKKGGSL